MKTLYFKFAVTTIMIMILSGLLSFLLSNTYYQQSLKKQNDVKVTNFALEVSGFINNKHSNLNLDEYLNHVAALGYQIHIVNEQGDKQYFGTKFREKNLPLSAKEEVFADKVYHGILEFPHKTFVTGFFANESKNTVGVPFQFGDNEYALFIRPDIKLLFNEMHLLFGWMLIIALSLSVLLVLVSTLYLVRPISKLNQATKEIEDGNFSIALDIDRKDEIGTLAGSFQGMAKRLGALDNMRKEFTSNISHDIQSPLSNIKGYLNLLKSDSLSQKESKQYIHIVDSEINRLSNLTKQLLLLSSLDSKREFMECKTFNIAAQIKSVIKQYQWSLSEKDITLSYSLPETNIFGDPSLIYSVWENLLTNAIKYNKDNGEIDIQLKDSPTEVFVSVKDSGIGLNDAEIERIYDRFYRSDASRTPTIQGTGLGLAIVQSIVQMHDGNITVKSTKDKVTTFIITLPKKL
jgi:signal transduction histidine kinase